MNFKEFLKPDWEKNLTFILIWILALVVGLILQYFFPIYCNPKFLLSLACYFVPFYYFIACLITWINKR